MLINSLTYYNFVSHSETLDYVKREREYLLNNSFSKCFTYAKCETFKHLLSISLIHSLINKLTAHFAKSYIFFRKSYTPFVEPNTPSVEPNTLSVLNIKTFVESYKPSVEPNTPYVKSCAAPLNLTRLLLAPTKALVNLTQLLLNLTRLAGSPPLHRWTQHDSCKTYYYPTKRLSKHFNSLFISFYLLIFNFYFYGKKRPYSKARL